MLHLDTRVHFNEMKLSPLIHQELDRTGVDVANARQRLAEDISNLCAGFRCHLGGRGFFQQFLMAALNAALALSEADNAAVRVSEYLELNVAGPLDILLHVEETRTAALSASESASEIGRAHV